MADFVQCCSFLSNDCLKMAIVTIIRELCFFKFDLLNPKNTFDMARNKELLNDRNLKIKKDYDEMYNKKGVRHDWCLEKLSEMYFLNKETIHRILFKKPKKEPKKEIEGESTTAS